MKPTIRKIILFTILVVAAIVLVALVLGKNKTNNTDVLQTTSLKTTTTPTDGTQAGKFLQSLSQVQAINLDTTFFNNKSYQRLVDFSITTVIEDPRLIGRPNPFAPLGADSIINQPVNPNPVVDPNAKKTN